MDSDREMIINDLKSLQLDYNFDRFTTDQLRAIRTKSIAERESVCRKIVSISKELGDKEILNYEELYKSKINIKRLKEYLALLQVQKNNINLFDFFMELSFGIKTSNDPELAKIIQDIKDLHFNYKFQKYTKEQLKAIRGRVIKERSKICEEIETLGHELGYSTYKANNFYYSKLDINKLKGIKSRLLKKQKRIYLVNQIFELAEALGYNDEKFILENMDQGHKSYEDLLALKEELEKEIHMLLDEQDKSDKNHINYDKDFALGDDPILTTTTVTIIPIDEVRRIAMIIDKIRKSGKSPYLKNIKRDRYKRIIDKYLNITEEQYKLLDEIDFERLINIYNNSIEDLDKYEEIGEKEFRHSI